MPARAILELGNPLLWSRSERVEDLAATETRAAIAELSDTLAAFREKNGFGRGIAAPQLGTLRRIIDIRMPAPGFAGVLINPEITSRSVETFELWDDCFSLPNLMVRVARARRIDLAYVDEHGASKAMVFEGAMSELVQHEVDHLDGILAIQRAVSPTALCTRDEWLRRYGGSVAQ
jgi:peptide deformylase